MYNGCANYATWNVKLWIANDESLYGLASCCSDYEVFKSTLRAESLRRLAYETPDGVAWSDSGIDHDEMVEFWNENFSNATA